MALTPVQIFNVNGCDALEKISNDKSISAIIADNIKTHYTINVDDAMKKLTQVGQLVQLAYSGSKGFPCSTQVLSVMSNYQDMVKESFITCSTFVSVSLKSLSFHKVAYLLAQKDQPSKALDILTKCAELAGKMADESDKLVQKSDNLVQLSVQALLEANENSNATKQQKDELIKRTNEVKAELKNREKQAESLMNQIRDAREDEEKAGKEARKNETISMVTSFFGPLFSSVSGKTAKLSEDARAREAASLKQRRELQEKERENNAILAEAVERLKNSGMEENELIKAITSLEITVNTMGKVKTVFLNAKQFWVGVKKHCEALTDTAEAQSYGDPDVFESLKDEFLDEIKKSGLGWMALGKVNRQAAVAMKTVDADVDKVMCELPNKEEADKLIQELSGKILSDISIENANIQKAIETGK